MRARYVIAAMGCIVLRYIIKPSLLSIAVLLGCNSGPSEVSTTSSVNTSVEKKTEASALEVSGEAKLYSKKEITDIVYAFFESLPESEKQTYADRNGNCGDVSISWPQALRGYGLKFNFEQTESTGKLRVDAAAPDRVRAESYLSKTHFFLTVDSSDGILYFDPSYLQFFEKVPFQLQNRLIFIGTESDLSRLYKTHTAIVRLDVAGDSNWGYYDDQQLYKFIYSSGEYDSGRLTIPIN